MICIDKLYKKDNYTIQKIINLEDELYSKLKNITKENFSANISDVINVCIENLIASENIKYYKKPDTETSSYRSVMIRKDNIIAMNKVTDKTGISMTRLVNMAIKEFLDTYNNH